ncbi:MAG TPA: pyrroline-5-carboxylate reductase [Acidimicrobiales bacterium]|nr:pyrroline-5-carboxylate reductase [Acidimicrobiales bacterium]
MTARLMVMGGGRMGEALVSGLAAAGWDDIVVVEKLAARRDELGKAGINAVPEPIDCDGVVIAVKPGDVEAACRSVGSVNRALSIAAGVPLAKLEAWLPCPVVRAMPNTPALVGAGASAIAGGPGADLDWAEEILAAVGTVVRVPEPMLDAVTGLSGSGPAYVFLVAEALIEGGVVAGLPRDTAVALASQTLLGAARLLVESDDGPEALRAAVTSPGGTTAAGLRALESRAVRSAFIEAVQAATARSRELG